MGTAAGPPENAEPGLLDYVNLFGPSMTVIPGPTEETVVAWSRGCPTVRGPSCTKGPLRNQSADRLLIGHHSAALPLTNS
jgi:hypothetical protein